MLSDLLQPLLIGVMVTIAIYIGLQRGSRAKAHTLTRVFGIFAGACGMLTTFWLRENPNALREYSAQIVMAGIAVVLALLGLARKL